MGGDGGWHYGYPNIPHCKCDHAKTDHVKGKGACKNVTHILSTPRCKTCKQELYIPFEKLKSRTIKCQCKKYVHESM